MKNSRRNKEQKPLLPLLFFLTLFAGLFSFAYQMIEGAPAVERLASLFVTAQPDTTVYLGYEELGQRAGYNSAERSHIALQYRDDGWWVSCIAARKKLLIKKGEREYFIKRIPLAKGDSFLIKKSKVIVQSVTPQSITLTGGTGSNISRAEWDREKKKLIVNTEQYKADDDDRGRPSAGDGEIGCFYLGGSLSLENQWGITGTLPRSLKIVFRDGIFSLAPARTGDVVLFRSGKGENGKENTPQTFQNQWFHLSGPDGRDSASWLIAGRTLYTLSFEPEGLRLVPQSKQVLFPAGEKEWLHTASFEQYGKKLSWVGEGASLLPWFLGKYGGGAGKSMGSWPVFLAALLLLLFFLTVSRNLLYNLFRYRLPAACNALLLLLPLLAALSFGARPSLILPLLLCWFSFLWTTCIFWSQGRLGGISGRIWFCVILLASAGIFTLLQLCAGSLNTAWLIFIQRQLTHLTLFALLTGLLCSLPVSVLKSAAESISLNPNRLRLLPLLQFLVVFSALLLLAANALWGSEGGLGWIQPSELLKFLFPLQAALIMPRLFLIRHSRALTPQEKKKAVLSLLVQVLILIVVGGGIFAIKHDFSPVVILAAYLFFCYSQLALFRLIPLFHLAIAGIFFIVLLTAAFDLHNNPNRWLWKKIPQHERILVWSNPYAAPHSGSQVIHSMELIGEGGWKGASPSWFGNNNSGNSLPAVQDDFIGAFLLYRFGGFAGGALIMMQIFFLYFLLLVDSLFYKEEMLSSLGNWQQRRQDGQLVEREVSIFFSFLLRSLLFILFLQWTISWGNCLGVLPVMGQPMTWLSSGNSHLWAVGFSVVLLGFWIVWWREK